jgi:hypothetical protein
MQEYDLQCKYDSRQSFYGKARVQENKCDDDDPSHKELFLWSYSTHVATISCDGKAIVYGTYSQTTLRHIKEFLLQYGFRADNSKQIMADYGVKVSA